MQIFELNGINFTAFTFEEIRASNEHLKSVRQLTPDILHLETLAGFIYVMRPEDLLCVWPDNTVTIGNKPYIFEKAKLIEERSI